MKVPVEESIDEIEELIEVLAIITTLWLALGGLLWT